MEVRERKWLGGYHSAMTLRAEGILLAEMQPCKGLVVSEGSRAWQPRESLEDIPL